jgi:peptidoglycan/LPS O-acetylase OafA/YrhL
MLFFGIPFFLVIVGSAMMDRLDNVRIPKLFLLMGDASYSTYLIHGSVISALLPKLKRFLPEQLQYTVVPMIFTAILVGVLLHLAVEKPILNFCHRYADKFKK